MKPLSNKNTIFVTPQSQVKDALSLIKNNADSHIMVFDNKKLIGMLPLESIENQDDSEKISAFLYELESFFTYEKEHWSEILELFGRYDCNIIPILNNSEELTGVYRLSEVIQAFAQTPFLAENGSFIILEKDQNKFSFSEITQIVESHHTKILGFFISEIFDKTIQITLKISTNNMYQLLQTFRRYGYFIANEQKEDFYVQDLKEKSDFFEKYINI